MSPEDGKYTPFEREVIEFMSDIKRAMADQGPRCNSHAADIKALDTRTNSLEDTRTFVSGALALATKISLAAVAISGVVYGWISALGVHP